MTDRKGKWSVSGLGLPIELDILKREAPYIKMRGN